MQDTKAFEPFYKVSQPGQVGSLYPSVTVAATAGGANASAVFAGSNNAGVQQVQIANLALTAWAYVNFGTIRDAQTVVAASVADSFPVPPLTSKVVTVSPEVNAASVILSAGSGNVTFTRGGGVG